MNRIIHKCWAGEYGSVDAVLQDLEFVHEDSMFWGVEEEGIHLRDE